MKFQALVYVIDPDGSVPESATIPVDYHNMNQLKFGSLNLEFLLAEIELRAVNNVHIVYNMKKGSKYYAL